MKRITLILLSIFLCQASGLADGWDDFSNVDRMWDGQKSITNKEFEQVMEKLEEKDKLKEQKQEKKRIKKLFGGGKTLHSEKSIDFSEQEVTAGKSKEEGILMNLPVQIILDGKILDKGFYKVFAEKDEESKKLYVNLYQSQYFKGKIEVVETEDDYGEKELDFVKILPYNDAFVRLIFGSIDFNAYAFLPYLE